MCGQLVQIFLAVEATVGGIGELAEVALGQAAGTGGVTRGAGSEVAEEVCEKALKQPTGFYEARGINDSVTRCTTDVDVLSAGLGVVLAKLVREPLKVVGMVAVAPRLTARFGPKTMTVSGLATLGAGLVWLSFIRPDGSFLVDVLPASLVTPAGLAMSSTPTPGSARPPAPPRAAGPGGARAPRAFRLGVSGGGR